MDYERLISLSGKEGRISGKITLTDNSRDRDDKKTLCGFIHNDSGQNLPLIYTADSVLGDLNSRLLEWAEEDQKDCSIKYKVKLEAMFIDSKENPIINPYLDVRSVEYQGARGKEKEDESFLEIRRV